MAADRQPAQLPARNIAVDTYLGAGLEPLVRGWAVLLAYSLILLWMPRRRISLRV